MKKTWGLQNSRSRMIALFIVDILSVILDSYLAIILRFKLEISGYRQSICTVSRAIWSSMLSQR